MAARPNLAGKGWVWRQYDTQVQANSIVTPGRDAGVIRLPGSSRGLALAADAKPLWCLADPFLGAAHTVVEAAANCVARGGRPLAITNCLNFGNPEDPLVMASFSRAVDGIAAAALALDTPIVSGNVSFYNESPAGAVPPTPTIGMVAAVDDIALAGGVPAAPGDGLLLLGDPQGWTLAGSEALRVLCPDEALGLPELDLPAAKETLERARALFPGARWLTDLSEGGLFVALLECLGEGAGAALEVPERTDWLGLLFSEAPARFLICWPGEETVPEGLLRVGEVSADKTLSCAGWKASFAGLCQAWEKTVVALVGEGPG